MNIEDLHSRVENIVHNLGEVAGNRVVGGFVPPFWGMGDIKLVIIGQDPTVANPKSREKITCTLNLDRKGALKNYIEDICRGLDVKLDNVYATNLFKYFYELPPARTPVVLKQHLDQNLRLLQDELSNLNLSSSCKIITLGEPVLQLLLTRKNQEPKIQLRDYWGYDKQTKQTSGSFNQVKESESKISRGFYPFCHQASMRKPFYMETFQKYIGYVKETGRQNEGKL